MALAPESSLKDSQTQYAHTQYSCTESCRPQANHRTSHRKVPPITDDSLSTKCHTTCSGHRNCAIASTSHQSTIESKSLSKCHSGLYRHDGPSNIEDSITVTQSHISEADQGQILLHVGGQLQDISSREVSVGATSNFSDRVTSQTRDDMPMERYLSQAAEEGPWNAVGVDASMCEWEFVYSENRRGDGVGLS